MKDTLDKDYRLIDFAFTKQNEHLYKWLEYEQYYRSRFSPKQWRKLEKSTRSKLFISVTRNTINIVRSIFSTSFFSSGCPIEITDINAIGGEQQAKITKVIKYYYDKLKPAKELNKAFLSSLIFGLGIVTTYWDNDKKRVITAHIPITDIAYDPNARNIDDVEFFSYEFNESLETVLYKIEKKIYNRKLKKDIFSDEQLDGNQERRFKVREIYRRKGLEWVYKTYINNICVRKSTISTPPFNWGIALESIARIDPAERSLQNLVYGESLVNYIKDLNDEVNQKRNQKNDIQEEMINPSILLADGSKVNPNDMKKGPGKRIRVEGKIADVQVMPSPSDYPINNDLSFLGKDINDASGLNNIQGGDTGASDRRSGIALAVVNSNSSTRITDMITLINETLFEHWAKDFVRLVLLNADDAVINKITGEEYPFGKKGKRETFEYEIKINFGITLDKEKRIADLMNLLLPVLQSPTINPAISERVLKEVLRSFLGDSDKLLDEIFTQQTPQQGGGENEDAIDPQEQAIANQLDMLK
jgi:hypothetical protein